MGGGKPTGSREKIVTLVEWLDRHVYERENEKTWRRICCYYSTRYTYSRQGAIPMENGKTTYYYSVVREGNH